MKIVSWLYEIFNPQEYNNIKISSIGDAFNDTSVRRIWLEDCLEEIKRINFEVDKRLLSGSDRGLIDLCARRRAYQDVLESILSARRQVTLGISHNPRPEIFINLDRLTE